MNTRLALGIGAGVAAFAAVTASAASLGGITANDLGADTSVVAACDTDGVDVSYTTSFDSTEYKVASVSLSDVAAACDGKSVKVTLADGSGSLGATTGTISGTSQSLTLSTPPSAKAVSRIAVVIAS